VPTLCKGGGGGQQHPAAGTGRLLIRISGVFANATDLASVGMTSPAPVVAYKGMFTAGRILRYARPGSGGGGGGGEGEGDASSAEVGLYKSNSVDPYSLKAPGFNPCKLKCDILGSKFAFKSNFCTATARA
jgi:hypothetical protein